MVGREISQEHENADSDNVSPLSCLGDKHREPGQNLEITVSYLIFAGEACQTKNRVLPGFYS